MKIEKIKKGFMHDSYIVDNDCEKIVLQKVNDVFGKRPNIEKISKYLKAKDFPSVEVLDNYRVTKHIDGETVLEPNEKQMLSACHLMETFHYVMRNYNSDKIDNHVVPELKEEYQKLYDLDLPLKTIHGDVKKENFLFDEDRAIALIDLDTVSKNYVCWDYANFICSWCGCETGKSNERWIRLILEKGKLLLPEEEYEAIKEFVKVLALEFHYRYEDYNYFNKLPRDYCQYRADNAMKFYNQFIEKVW